MAVILVIEDDDQVATLITDIVALSGHTTDRAAAAYSGCLRMLQSGCSYDLVIMDLLLQGADGAIAALALRGLGYNGPILVVTGNLVPIDVGLYTAAKFAGRMLKPFGIEELRAEIDRQLAKNEPAPSGTG